METKEDLYKIKDEDKKSQELSEDDLKKVTGGDGIIVDTELENRVMSIISQQCSVPCSIINPYSKLVIDLGLDSLDIVDLIQTLEEEFKIMIDDVGFSSLVTVKDVINYIDNRVNPKL